MNLENKKYLYPILWIISFILGGFIIGFLTKSDVNIWYADLNRSSLTPPNYIFPIAWTILYGILGFCGWIIWNENSFSQIRTIKIIFIIQMILNLSWTPLFFTLHLSGISLIILFFMDILVTGLIFLTYKNIRLLSLLMTPYLLWILFATYLNFYIFLNN